MYKYLYTFSNWIHIFIGSGIYSGTQGALNKTIHGIDKTVLLTIASSAKH